MTLFLWKKARCITCMCRCKIPGIAQNSLKPTRFHCFVSVPSLYLVSIRDWWFQGTDLFNWRINCTIPILYSRNIVLWACTFFTSIKNPCILVPPKCMCIWSTFRVFCFWFLFASRVSWWDVVCNRSNLISLIRPSTAETCYWRVCEVQTGVAQLESAVEERYNAGFSRGFAAGCHSRLQDAAHNDAFHHDLVRHTTRSVVHPFLFFL